MKTIISLLGLILGVAPALSFGQCVPPSPSCSGCIPLTASGQSLSSGIYCVTGSLSNITIQSGAVVCLSGSGSLVNSNLNGGTLLYNSGTLPNFNTSSGDVRIRGPLSNPPNFNNVRIIVETGGVLTLNNFDVNGSLVVDGGLVNVAGLLRINGSGSICLANRGQISAQYLQNNRLNGTTAESSRGCIRLAQPQNGQTNLNNSLTGSSNVLVCLPGSYTPANLGSATVTNNCTDCSVALPVTYTYFRAQPQTRGIRLEWETASELHHSHFIVERSVNALDFSVLSGPVIDPFRYQNSRKQYRYIDSDLLQGTVYYRLKQVDSNDSFAYSNLISVSVEGSNPVLQVSPNPVVDQVKINLETEGEGLIDTELSDSNGKIWFSQRGHKTEKVYRQTLNLPPIPKGLYLISVRLGHQFFIRKIVR